MGLNYIKETASFLLDNSERLGTMIDRKHEDRFVTANDN